MTKFSWFVIVTSGRCLSPASRTHSFRKICPVYAAKLVKLRFLLQTPWRVLTRSKQKKVLFYFGYLERRGTFRGTADAWLHVCSRMCKGDDGWSSATLCLCAVAKHLWGPSREVIMLLLRPSERTGDRRGCADAAAERPNYWPPLHFWRARSSSESRDNDDSSVLTGMRSLLKPQRKAASAMGSFELGGIVQTLGSSSGLDGNEVISKSDVLSSDPGIKASTSCLIF